MSIINAIVQFVMDLGGGVFLPFTILILGIIFKQKPFDALRNGLRDRKSTRLNSSHAI